MRVFHKPYNAIHKIPSAKSKFLICSLYGLGDFFYLMSQWCNKKFHGERPNHSSGFKNIVGKNRHFNNFCSDPIQVTLFCRIVNYHWFGILSTFGKSEKFPFFSNPQKNQFFSKKGVSVSGFLFSKRRSNLPVSRDLIFN